MGVRVVDWRTALCVRLHIRLTALRGCCKELYALVPGDVYHRERFHMSVVLLHRGYNNDRTGAEIPALQLNN